MVAAVVPSPARRSRAPRAPKVEVITDPVEAARAAKLRYVSDTTPGIRRARDGAEWEYTAPDGAVVRDEETLARIKSLAIPPAWTDVWICPRADGHIQATGRDARGRKQYRYHPRWRAVRDETKYGRMVHFAQTLPRIRRAVDEHLALPGLPREKVLATVVRLLESTLIRVGNSEYARDNESYGLTTMREEHADVNGSTVKFTFKGKSGKEHTVGLRDRRLARIIKRCQELPGEDLFQYVNGDGRPQTISSSDVNEYLRAITGEDFTAKDFRTWAGTVLAAMALHELPEFDSEAQAKRNIVEAVKRVAHSLGNTPAVCRKCYVHPAVIDAYLDGTVLSTPHQRKSEETGDPGGLAPEEVAVLALLQRRLGEETAARKAS